jgi:hypothetical protein
VYGLFGGFEFVLISCFLILKFFLSFHLPFFSLHFTDSPRIQMLSVIQGSEAIREIECKQKPRKVGMGEKSTEVEIWGKE